MTVFIGRLKIVGIDGSSVPRTFTTADISGADLGAEFLTAKGLFDTLVTLFQALTNAHVVSYDLSYQNTFAGAANGNLQDTMNANVYTTDVLPNGQFNTGRLNIPAVLVDIMEGTSGEDYNRLDRSSAEWAAFMAHVEPNFTISDGEVISPTAGVNSTKSGYRVAKAKNYGG